MREDDGRKLDRKTLEQLRIRAVGQVEHGTHPEEVAAALGMARAAVYGWLAKYREGGLDALRASPSRDGRPPCPADSWPDSTDWSWATIRASYSSPLRCGPAPSSAS